MKNSIFHFLNVKSGDLLSIVRTPNSQGWLEAYKCEDSKCKIGLIQLKHIMIVENDL